MWSSSIYQHSPSVNISQYWHCSCSLLLFTTATCDSGSWEQSPTRNKSESTRQFHRLCTAARWPLVTCPVQQKALGSISSTTNSPSSHSLLCNSIFSPIPHYVTILCRMNVSSGCTGLNKLNVWDFHLLKKTDFIFNLKLENVLRFPDKYQHHSLSLCPLGHIRIHLSICTVLLFPSPIGFGRLLSPHYLFFIFFYSFFYTLHLLPTFSCYDAFWVFFQSLVNRPFLSDFRSLWIFSSPLYSSVLISFLTLLFFTYLSAP